tara:strand:+ start:233 stop:592 length:360 start_codon:yes stop_codon:yes gene_type:complete
MTDPMNARDMISKALAPLVNRPNMAADAVLAILPDMVVPLVWEWESDFHCTELFVAKTSLGQYSAFASEEEQAGYYVELEDGAISYSGGPFSSMDEAKAAANAHNVAQVMAGLGIGVDK